MLIATMLLLCLPACGFQPMYGTQGLSAVPAVESHFDQIEIANIPDREGQYLRNALIDRLHAQGQESARYVLSVTRLTKNVIGLGVRKDATTTRGQIDINGTLRLADRTTGQVVLTRPVSASAGYNRLNNLYATMVSEENSTNQALDELAETIVTELSLHFARQKDGTAQP